MQNEQHSCTIDYMFESILSHRAPAASFELRTPTHTHPCARTYECFRNAKLVNGVVAPSLERKTSWSQHAPLPFLYLAFLPQWQQSPAYSWICNMYFQILVEKSKLKFYVSHLLLHFSNISELSAIHLIQFLS